VLGVPGGGVCGRNVGITLDLDLGPLQLLLVSNKNWCAADETPKSLPSARRGENRREKGKVVWDEKGTWLRKQRKKQKQKIKKRKNVHGQRKTLKRPKAGDEASPLLFLFLCSPQNSSSSFSLLPLLPLFSLSLQLTTTKTKWGRPRRMAKIFYWLCANFDTMLKLKLKLTLTSTLTATATATAKSTARWHSLTIFGDCARCKVSTAAASNGANLEIRENSTQQREKREKSVTID